MNFTNVIALIVQALTTDVPLAVGAYNEIRGYLSETDQATLDAQMAASGAKLDADTQKFVADLDAAGDGA